MTLTSCSVPFDRKTRVTGEEMGRQFLSELLDANVGDALEQHLEEDLRLEPREMGTQTKMRPLPEPEVDVIAAGRREPLGIDKFSFVTIGRNEIKHDFIAGPDRLACYCRIRDGGAPHCHDGRH